MIQPFRRVRRKRGRRTTNPSREKRKNGEKEGRGWRSIPYASARERQQALKSSEQVNELRNLVLRLLADGQSREAVLKLFEQSRRELRQANQETEEDALMDEMDLLLDWCSPHVRLPPEQQTSGRRA
jgi:hypothetical protein